MIHHTDDHLTVHIGDCREVLAGLPAESVHCVVTSPPYWGLRDYGVEGAIGLEATHEAFIAVMVDVFREVKRVLRNDGTLWLNMGDSFDTKQLVGMPWRLAFALQADGWYLRSDIIWSKPNPMPESVTDRPTKAHEYVFLLTKSARYYYDAEAVREASLTADMNEWPGSWKRAQVASPTEVRTDGFKGDTIPSAGRNLRSVWQIATEPYPGAHFATFPQKLVEPCIKAGTSERGVCPECGAPWAREVDKVYRSAPTYMNGSGEELTKGRNRNMTRAGDGFESITTTGWHPSCRCDVNRGAEATPGPPFPPVPATVLDPFAGSGTTGLVANCLGRRAILIDLSADYIDQAMLRNQQHPLGLIG